MPLLMQDTTVQRLAQVPLFSSLSNHELQTLSRAGILRHYDTGDRIVTQGEKGIGFYLVLEGRVEVRSGGVTRASLEPGSFFGEMALFEEQSRTADVVAVGPSTCLVLSRWEFWSQMAREPDVLKALMTSLVHRLRSTSHALTD